MISGHKLAICAVSIVLVARVLAAEDLARYRNFALGSNVDAVAVLTGVNATEAKLIHQRPAVLQDLDWRPSRWIVGSTAASTDPVEQIVFSFYNDQLFRIVADYAHDRTEGMTDTDMIEAISAAYGAPVKRTGAVRAASRVETESGSAVARWGDTEHAVVLYRTTSYRATFRLIVTDTRLDNLARKAETEAGRLDEQEAPAREIARQKKEREDNRAAADKARAANKGGFRP